MEKTANTQLTKQEKEQLFRALWNVADVLRGAMTADNFRDYMLSLLFYRYISARYEAAARMELGSDLPADKPLYAWYAENEADVAEFEDMMLKGTHYIIKPKYLWSAIYELARTQDDNLLTELKNSFRHIEEESFKGAFKGLFSEINLDSSPTLDILRGSESRACQFVDVPIKHFGQYRILKVDTHGVEVKASERHVLQERRNRELMLFCVDLIVLLLDVRRISENGAQVVLVKAYDFLRNVRGDKQTLDAHKHTHTANVQYFKCHFSVVLIRFLIYLFDCKDTKLF